MRLLEPGTILHCEKITEDAVFIVIRGFASICAYLGVIKEHVAAGFPYSEMDETLNVHGGFTFSGDGTQLRFVGFEDFYFYGWDYGHAGDYTFYGNFGDLFVPRRWLLHEVIADSREVIQQFLRWKEKKEGRWKS